MNSRTTTHSRIALVTGANKDVGHAIARQFATLPATVYLGARDTSRGQNAANASRRHLGISTPWHAPSQTPADDMRQSFETNVLGYITVTNTMLPLLRHSEAARIVNISSVIGSLTAAAENHDPTGAFPDGGFPNTLGYPVSKAAVNALTIMYANERRTDGILVNAVSPNWVPTDANGHSGLLTLEQGALLPVKMATLPDGGPTGTFTCSDATGEGLTLPW
ncbi:SDR family NAD(P)-dependent oxidoreductase [Streptomyces sp. NPDC059096]|uniref:SDR family NAD(P)-dependent oxidoreductase n=1 Tax=Streptomyces sp. NPDC059096 TaxID=3346727 RepID=UPI003675177B